MQISVIIPTYSPGEYLFACVEAILKQTLDKDLYEVVIVLNGIRDPYMDIINNYIQGKSCTIKLYYTEKKGVSNARNIGINVAKGEYITFVDDDDIVSPTYLEGLLAVSSATCVGCANCYKFTESVEDKYAFEWTESFFRLQNEQFSLWKFRQYLSPPWMKLIHRSIIGDTRFNTSMQISEDALFCAEISSNIKDMQCATESVIYYIREREGSATRKKMKVSYIFRLTLKKIYLFWKIYLSAPSSYNFPFFFSRTLASMKHLKDLLKYSEW